MNPIKLFVYVAFGWIVSFGVMAIGLSACDSPPAQCGTKPPPPVEAHVVPNGGISPYSLYREYDPETQVVCYIVVDGRLSCVYLPYPPKSLKPLPTAP